MVLTISDALGYLPITDNGEIPIYEFDDIKAIKNQGAEALALMDFKSGNAPNSVKGIVGVKGGILMNKPDHLIALPCPIYCPE